MAFTEVGSGSQRASTHLLTNGPATLAYPGNVTAGNLLIGAGIAWKTGAGVTSISIDDTLTTSYTVILSDVVTDGSGEMRVFIWYGVATGSGANTVTFGPASNVYCSFSIDEFSGQHASPLDASTTTPNTGTSTDPTFSFNTATSDTLIIGVFGHGNGSAPSLSVDAPSSQFGESETDNVDMAHSAAFRIISGAAGTYATDWTSSGSVHWAAIAASFAPASAGGSGVIRRRGRMTLGVG